MRRIIREFTLYEESPGVAIRIRMQKSAIFLSAHAADGDYALERIKLFMVEDAEETETESRAFYLIRTGDVVNCDTVVPLATVRRMGPYCSEQFIHIFEGTKGI